MRGRTPNASPGRIAQPLEIAFACCRRGRPWSLHWTHSGIDAIGKASLRALPRLHYRLVALRSREIFRSIEKEVSSMSAHSGFVWPFA